jgi:hypothetical protein
MNKFILMWDCYGLEACVDITEKLERGNDFEREKIFEILKNPETEPHNEAVAEINRMVHMMQLRARFNPQRNYEIYMLSTTDSISKEDVTEWFEESPQQAAERTRELGVQLLSHRETNPERRVIS